MPKKMEIALKPNEVTFLSRMTSYDLSDKMLTDLLKYNSNNSNAPTMQF